MAYFSEIPENFIVFSEKVSIFAGGMSELEKTYFSLIKMSSLVADEIVRRLDPLKDEITKMKAMQEYGVGFIQDALSSGLVNVHYISHRHVLSRRELNAYRSSLDMVKGSKVDKGVIEEVGLRKN